MPSYQNTPADISQLSELLKRSRLYGSSEALHQLLVFIAKLPHIAPFNAFLLNVQRPELRFAASEDIWIKRFERRIKENARPLVILHPFAPVKFVYDMADTEGEPLPEHILHSFSAELRSNFHRHPMTSFVHLCAKHGIHVVFKSLAENHGGSISTIEIVARSDDKKIIPNYQLHLNSNHPYPVQFGTLTHELAHLMLGHLGPDRHLNIPDRPNLSKAIVEIEAECTAWLTCERNGIALHSESYLYGYLREHENCWMERDQPDLHEILKAVSRVENLLGLDCRS